MFLNLRAQVVGWPPVRSFRKNILAVQKNSSSEAEKSGSSTAAAFVKVSVDGAPYLRKVDLKNFQSYQELSEALSKMFSSFTIGKHFLSLQIYVLLSMKIILLVVAQFENFNLHEKW